MVNNGGDWRERSSKLITHPSDDLQSLFSLAHLIFSLSHWPFSEHTIRWASIGSLSKTLLTSLTFFTPVQRSKEGIASHLSRKRGGIEGASEPVSLCCSSLCGETWKRSVSLSPHSCWKKAWRILENVGKKSNKDHTVVENRGSPAV